MSNCCSFDFTIYYYSPDGITTSGRLIEVKCPLRRVPTNEVPTHYKYQVQFLMHTLRLKDCDFIQYVPKGYYLPETFIVTRVNYDPHFFYSKLPILRRFWDDVLETRAYMTGKKNREIKAENSDDDDDDNENDGSCSNKIIIKLGEEEKEMYYKENNGKRKRNGKKEKPLVVCVIDKPSPQPPKSERSVVKIPDALMKAMIEYESGGISVSSSSSSSGFVRKTAVDDDEPAFCHITY